MANRRFIDFPIASTVGENDIVLIWQSGANKQTTKATLLSGVAKQLNDLTDVTITSLANGQILQYDSVTGQWINVDRTDIDLSELGDVSIISPANGQVLVYNSATAKWENSSGGYVPYVGAVTTVDLGLQGLEAGFIRLDTSITSPPTGQGTMYWDQDEETVAIILNGSTTKVGEDIFFQVKNQSGATIPKGTAVRFDGVIGASGRVKIVPFLANGSNPSIYFLGVTYEAIADGADGKALFNGKIRNVNTTAFAVGDILYASPTVVGGFTTTKPVAPNNIISVAAVLSSGANGILLIRPQIGSNINNDEGVKITTPTTGDLLQLQASGLWENKSVSSLNLVPQSRTLTINEVSFDLSANRSWSIPVHDAVTIGTANGLSLSGQVLSLGLASGSINGALSSTDWTTFNSKQNALTLTTIGTSGAATLVGATLNIPNYGSALSGYVPYTGATANVNLGVYGLTATSITDGNITISLAQINRVANLVEVQYNGVGGVQFFGNSAYPIIFTSGTGAASFSSSLTASSIIKSGGTSSQFLKADGSVDSNTYITGGPFLPLTGGTLIGALGGTSASFSGQIQAATLTDGIVTMSAAQINRTAGFVELQFTGNGGVKIFGNTAYPVTFTSGTGNVIIGNTTDEGFKLDVNGTGRFSGQLNLLHSNSTAIFKVEEFSGTQGGGISLFNSTGIHNVLFNAGGDSFIRGGNLGIGATSPSLGFSGNIANVKLALRGGTPGSAGGTSVFLIGGDNNHYSSITAEHTGGGNTYLAFATSTGATNPSEKMRITSGGNLLINTPTDEGFRLDVNGTGRFTGNVILESSSNRYLGFGTGSADPNILFASNGNIIMNVGVGDIFTLLRGGSSFASFSGIGLDISIGGVRTTSPYLSTNATWRLGTFSSISATPNGKIRVQIGGRYYNIPAEDLGEVPV
jgi:hypothetical protein